MRWESLRSETCLNGDAGRGHPGRPKHDGQQRDGLDLAARETGAKAALECLDGHEAFIGNPCVDEALDRLEQDAREGRLTIFR